MSEKPKFEWTATRLSDEEGDRKYLDSIIKELNETNRKLGRPEVRIMTKEEARTGVRSEQALAEDRMRAEELDKSRETELAKSRELELEKARALELQRDRDMEKTRGFDVRRIMAEDEAAARERKSDIKIIKQPSEFDPDMQELTVEKTQEIDVIGQGTKPVDEKLAEKVDKIMAMKKEYAEIQEKLAKMKKPEPELEPESELEQPKPLVAVGVDWTKSEDRMARKMAREDLKEELKDAGIIKRIWKGRLFRNLYEDIYMDEYLTGERVNKDGDTLYDIINKQKDEMMDGIVLDVTEEVREKNKEEMDKRLVPMDQETNKKIRSTIEDYARFMYEMGEIRPDMANDPKFVAEVDKKFDRYIFGILERAEDKGKIKGYIESNNYLDVAKEAASRYKEAIRNARSKVEQDAAMAKVMYGFKAYNYESTKRFSNEHRDNIDKIMDKLGKKKIVSAETFSRAVDEVVTEEDELIDNVKKAEELIGGEEGIKIMLDKSPISIESQKRWQKWWGDLSDEGRTYVRDLVKQVNAYPDRYNLKWGNGFRTWLTIVNARDILAA